jgi:hypothetical protein
MPSVAVQNPYNEYSANGATTVFPYTFQLLRASDLVVTVSGVVVTNYTVSGLGNQAGGSITFSSAPAAGTLNVLLKRVIPLSRAIEYTRNGDFNAPTVNLDFQLLWMALQNIASIGGGELRLPYPEQASQLATKASRLDRVLSFNSGTGAAEMSSFTVTQVASVIAAIYSAAAGPLDALSFVQGGTGALTRTGQNKSREILSAKDFLTADGSFTAGGNPAGTDNLAKMVQLLAYAESIGADIYAPAGQYYFSAGFELPQGVRIHGAGIVHAPTYIAGTSARGTIFLINGQVGGDCITFEENAAGSGLSELSVFNTNTNAIRAVVAIVGHLYPCLGSRVEIASLRPTTGVGLLLDSSASAPNFETLWGDFFGTNIQIGDIGLGTEYSVATGLKINGTSTTRRPNTNTFHGGNIQGKTAALLMDGDAANAGPIGASFHGTRFDTVYSTAVTPTFVASAAGVVEYPIGDVYTYPCVTLNRALNTAFMGCYFETASLPATYDDGVNGVHPVIGVAHVTSSTQVRRTGFVDCAFNGVFVRDQGTSTRVVPTNAGYTYDTTTHNLLAVRANAVQTVPSGAFTRVVTPTVVAGNDAFISWNSGSNLATVHVDGVYQISGRVEFAGWVAASSIVLSRITAGGAVYKGSICPSSDPASPLASVVSLSIQLFRGDTIAFDAFHNEGTAQDTSGAASDTWLTISKV